MTWTRVLGHSTHQPYEMGRVINNYRLIRCIRPNSLHRCGKFVVHCLVCGRVQVRYSPSLNPSQVKHACRCRRPDRFYELFDGFWLTVKEIAQEAGISSHMTRRRLMAGETAWEIVQRPKFSPFRQRTAYLMPDGSWLSQTEIAARMRVTRERVRQICKQGRLLEWMGARRAKDLEAQDFNGSPASPEAPAARPPRRSRERQTRSRVK